jgi:hypothetical protein
MRQVITGEQKALANFRGAEISFPRKHKKRQKFISEVVGSL